MEKDAALTRTIVYLPIIRVDSYPGLADMPKGTAHSSNIVPREMDLGHDLPRSADGIAYFVSSRSTCGTPLRMNATQSLMECGSSSNPVA